MRRRDFLHGVAGAAAVGALPRFPAGAAEKSATRPPNIIFIMADDLGYGHLGCYGQEHIKTPHIDRLAREGMRFTQTYSGCAVCAPCRSVLMTGLHMGHTPVRGNSGGIPLRDEDVTIAEVLKKAGYATGGFGKWGLGDANTPGVATRQGFDEFFGYYHQVHAHFFYPEYLWHNDEKVPLPGNAGGKRGQYSHDEIMKRALAFIRANKDRPFFCYLPVTIPHVELVVPEDSEKPYRGKFEKVLIRDPRPGYISSEDSFATYAGMISRLDDGVGQVMALLKELNLDDNTIVFFTSDNGAQGGPWQPLVEQFNGSGPFRATKGSMYEGGTRVPMIARWPGRIAPGSESDHPWYFADVMATFAELAGVLPAENTDGISVVPTLLGAKAAGREQVQHRYLYWELGSGKRLRQAIRMGDWKGVREKPGAPLELYDLSRDIGEKDNVAHRNPDIVRQLEIYLKTARTEPPPQIEPDKPKGQRYR